MAKKTSLDARSLQEHLPTVRYWARHYAHRKHNVLDYDDLYIMGIIGLMDAVKRFRPEKHALFKSYAEFRIRGEIVDELRRQDWMTRTERHKHKVYQNAETHLGHELGRHPTRQELAQVLAFPSVDLDRLAQYDQHETLRPYTEGELASHELQDNVAETVERHDELMGLLNHLTAPMRLIMEMRYYQDASVEEIAQAIGLSLGRVSQLHNEAIELMRAGKRNAA